MASPAETGNISAVELQALSPPRKLQAPADTGNISCMDVQPPSHWKNPTCESQLANTDNCAKRRDGERRDGYCSKTCGVCVPVPEAEPPVNYGCYMMRYPDLHGKGVDVAREHYFLHGENEK